MFAPRKAAGTYTGTGAAQSITIGFQPSLVLIYNETDGDSLHVKLEGQADGVGLAIGAATAAVASQGVTLSARGFSVGTDASVSEIGKTFRYLAL